MAFDKQILHNVGGVKSFEMFKEGEYGYSIVKCGICELMLSVKPSVVFNYGVVAFNDHTGKIKQTLCDDPRVVGTFIAAFAGYGRTLEPDQWGRPLYAPDDPEFDFDKWPEGKQRVLSIEEAVKYLDARNVPHPGFPLHI